MPPVKAALVPLIPRQDDIFLRGGNDGVGLQALHRNRGSEKRQAPKPGIKIVCAV